MYKKISSSLVKFLDPEIIHIAVLKFFSLPPISYLTEISKNKYLVEDPKLAVSVAGLVFKNPVGLAAGFDKNSICPKALSSFGFGHIEVGTITPLAQKGKPKPRIFRLFEDSALINRLGFPNKGIASIKPNLLKEKERDYILGINIGPNAKSVQGETADKDYLLCMNELKNLGDYFTINISSPNTAGLRDLAAKKTLESLLKKIIKEKKDKKIKLPMFIKISPDLTKKQLDDLLTLVLKYRLDGIIATNTTVERPKSLKNKNKNEAGGLSGKPLKNKSTQIIKYIHKKTKGKIPIIGVGGIFNAEDAIQKIKSGATLIQLYTGFIYEGPACAKNINLGILKYLKENNLESIKNLTGSDSEI